jgi:hypothetical protein
LCIFFAYMPQNLYFLVATGVQCSVESRAGRNRNVVGNYVGRPETWIALPAQPRAAVRAFVRGRRRCRLSGSHVLQPGGRAGNHSHQSTTRTGDAARAGPDGEHGVCRRARRIPQPVVHCPLPDRRQRTRPALVRAIAGAGARKRRPARDRQGLAGESLCPVRHQRDGAIAPAGLGGRTAGHVQSGPRLAPARHDLLGRVVRRGRQFSDRPGQDAGRRHAGAPERQSAVHGHGPEFAGLPVQPDA